MNSSVLNNFSSYTTSNASGITNPPSIDFILTPFLHISPNNLRDLNISISDLSNNSILFNLRSFDLYNEINNKNPNEFVSIDDFIDGNNVPDTGIPLKFRKLYFKSFRHGDRDSSNQAFSYFLCSSPVSFNSGNGIITSQFCDLNNNDLNLMSEPSENNTPSTIENRISKSSKFNESGIIIGNVFRGFFQDAPNISDLKEFSECPNFESVHNNDFNDIYLHGIVGQPNSESLCDSTYHRNIQLFDFLKASLITYFSGIVTNFGVNGDVLHYDKVSPIIDSCQFDFLNQSYIFCPSECSNGSNGGNGSN